MLIVLKIAFIEIIIYTAKKKKTQLTHFKHTVQ